jgi:dTDP-4-dehydrorhamnose 3,5-epimerase
MDVETTALEGVLILTPKRYGDGRGFFMESYNRSTFANVTGLDIEFIQDNHSRSAKGVLRGLHFQLPPHAQSKLVRVVQGEIFDVAVDIRRNSATFGRWTGATLSAENAQQLWVPTGFAHGFLVTSETAEVIYKVDAPYAPECERSIIWKDNTIGIEWPTLEQPPLVSPKDRDAPPLSSANLFG